MTACRVLCIVDGCIGENGSEIVEVLVLPQYMKSCRVVCA